MILSHRHRFIFIKTKKTGGTSVELALSRLCGPDDILTPTTADDEPLREGFGPRNFRVPRSAWPLSARVKVALGLARARHQSFHSHMTARQIRAMLPAEVWRDYVKLTIERNPWDRQVSLYYWHFRNKTDKPSFDDFIEKPWLRKYSKNWSIYAVGGKPSAEIVLRYESLEEDFAAALKRLGLSETLELPEAKSGVRPRGEADYRAHYSARTRATVGRWYAREIEAFGYAF